MSATDEPLFSRQWYLHNTGQDFSESGTDDPGVAGVDLRVLGAWPAATGAGVRVGVLDTGTETSHPDLQANIVTDAGYDAVTGRAGPAGPVFDSDNHGTQVAGVIAAAANGIEIVGVAYDASLAIYRKFFPGEDGDGAVEPPEGYDDDKATAAVFHRQLAEGIDISSNSWGPTTPEPEDTDVAAAIAELATQGRDGLGTVIVFAGGNERFYTLDANAYGDQVDPRTISVAAIDHTGAVSVFSNAGANILVSAPGENILTTDRSGSAGENAAAGSEGDDTLADGTSFAAPAVSGVVALMLEANPELGARDVQEILAYSAWSPEHSVNWLADKDVLRQQLQQYAVFQAADQRPDHQDGAGVALLNDDAYLQSLVSPVDWQFNGALDWNGGGLHASHDYGYGLVDAAAAVRLAETWDTRTGTFTDWTVETLKVATDGLEVPGNDASGVRLAVTVDEADALRVQKVEVDLHLDLPPQITQLDLFDIYDGLDLRLVSPSGTVAVLAHGFSTEATIALQGLDRSDLTSSTGDSSDLSLSFLTNMSWGEYSEGSWTLQVADKGHSGLELKLDSFDLTFYGDRPTASDTYVFTDEYAPLAHYQPDRQVLSDTDGGVDTVNFAAVTSDLRVRLDGGAGEIDGAAWQTAEPGSIEHAYGGAGDDVIVGNARSNRLAGMAGGDSLWGLSGDDVLRGGDGGDHLYGGPGWDRLFGQRGDDWLFGGVGNGLLWAGDGDDVLYGGAARDRLYGGNGHDRLFGGEGGDRLHGDAGSDVLYGGRGRDVIDGGAGDDLVLGGGAADLVSGGAGADRFLFRSLADLGDTITDFGVGRGGDVIDLRPMALGDDAELRLLGAGTASRIELAVDDGYVAVAVLQHVTGVTLSELEADGNLLF